MFNSPVLLLPFLLLSLSTFAEPKISITYGGEIEVTRPGLKAFDPIHDVAEETNVKTAQLDFVEKMKERCLISKCKIREVTDSWDKDYIVEYKDGWWFKVSYDPGCVEFTFKPSTLQELREKKDLINDQIFKTAALVGLHPALSLSGHFNIGVKSAFGNDASKFLRFIIDYTNNDHLAFGSLGKDYFNAPPISLLSKQQKEALKNLVDDVNSGRIIKIETVAEYIQNKVYTKSYYDNGTDSPFHYQAIGLKHIVEAVLSENDAPLELRAIRGQLTAEDFISLAELFEARINYLNQLKSPIVYSNSSKRNYSFKELNTRFAIFLEESGLRYEKYKRLLPKDIQDAGFDLLLMDEFKSKFRLNNNSSFAEQKVNKCSATFRSTFF